MNKQKTLIFSLSALLFLATSFIVYSWSEPTGTMPSDYTAPLNESDVEQYKHGVLGAQEFRDFDDNNYYINPSGDSVVAGTITVADPTDDNQVATKGYVDAIGSPVVSRYFGNGVDGDVTISTNTTLTKDMEYKNLTIKSGVTLNPNGWRIFVSGTLTIESGGKISRDGNNGGAYTSVGGGLATNRVGGSASGGYCYYGCGNGCTYGCSAAGNGEFGAGGTGGSAPGGFLGGAGGTGANTNIILREYIDPPSQSQLALLPSLTLAQLGGGGGGGGATNDYEIDGLNGTGGGGGGIMHIFARTVVNNGTISARGGNGGNGSEYFYHSEWYGGGGGGGGGGGYILLVYNTKTGAGTIDVSGGLGGLGANPSHGFYDGQNGNSGIINEYQVNL